MASETKTNRIILATKRIEKKKSFAFLTDKIAHVPGNVLVFYLLVMCTLNYTSLVSAVVQSYT